MEALAQGAAAGLEELSLKYVYLPTGSVRILAGALEAGRTKALQHLKGLTLENAGLSARDLAMLLRGLARGPDLPDLLEVTILGTGGHEEHGWDDLVLAISQILRGRALPSLRRLCVDGCEEVRQRAAGVRGADRHPVPVGLGLRVRG